jgi:hypothetical protein
LLFEVLFLNKEFYMLIMPSGLLSAKMMEESSAWFWVNWQKEQVKEEEP